MLKSCGTLIDVRSPKEYKQGHIPSAYSLPLFSDQERHEVGFLYKKEGKQAAIDLGCRFVGPKLSKFLEKTKNIKQPFTIYCARGGMRSNSITSFFSTLGIDCTPLPGGYKTYRNQLIKLFTIPWKLIVLSGMTGVGKTEKLYSLKEQGEQIIDLEKLANHRGSAFGALGPQPTTEQFQNNLGEALKTLDPEREVYIEDESQVIGSCHIPTPLFIIMRQAKLLVLKKPLEERLEQIARSYSHLSKDQLITSAKKIERRLGGVRCKEVISLIHAGKLKQAATLVLHYYDKAYEMSFKKRKSKNYFS